MEVKHKLLIEVEMDDFLWPELGAYVTAATDDGWGNEPENGLWYFCQEVCDEVGNNRGIRAEIVV